MFRMKNNRSTRRGDLRKILVEPLEQRQLLAADAAAAFGSSFLIMDVSEDDFSGMGAMASLGQRFGMESGKTGFSSGSVSAPYQFLISGDDGSLVIEIDESNADLFGIAVGEFDSGAVVSATASGASEVSEVVEFEITESNMDAVLKGLPEDFKPAQLLPEGSYVSEMVDADAADFESGVAVASSTSGAVADVVRFVLELTENGDGVSFEIDESMLGLLATGFPTDVTPSASTTSNGNVSQVGSGLSIGVLSTAKDGVKSQQNASSSGAQVVVNRTQAGSNGVSKASSQPEASLFSQQMVQKRLRAGAWPQQELVDLALSDLLWV